MRQRSKTLLLSALLLGGLASAAHASSFELTGGTTTVIKDQDGNVVEVRTTYDCSGDGRSCVVNEKGDFEPAG